MNPRPSVRAARVDVGGEFLNVYDLVRRTDGQRPSGPWAVYLADARRQFRLLGFDLDAGRGDPHADAVTLSGWLDQAGLAYVVTRSGPTDGRHVWLALAEVASPELVRHLARTLAAALPTLDCTPLLNAATGCLRPPGAPHGQSGSATVLTGDLYTLMAPTTTLEGLQRLLALLPAVPDIPALPHESAALLPVDVDGCRYLPGARRERLPLYGREALAADTNGRDANGITMRALLGAVRSRWRCHELLPLLESSPGLEHLRSHNLKNGRRRPRSRAETLRILHRQWDRAVDYALDSTSGDLLEDPASDYAQRMAATHTAVTAIQTRAAACPGRWSRNGGPSDRRVLDALSLLATLALTLTLDAAIRHIALMTGLSRETVRRAYARLQADNWITDAGAHEGTKAATWTLLAPSSTEFQHCDVSQEAPPPPPTHPCEDPAPDLRARLAAQAHDVFTPRSALGHAAGLLYAELRMVPTRAEDLPQRVALPHQRVEQLLERLTRHGLLEQAGRRLSCADERRRETAAAALGAAGTLERRRLRYATEQEQWRWWNDELEWLRAPRRLAAKRRPGAGQLSTSGEPRGRPAYPRTDGRPDHRQALAEACTLISSSSRGRASVRSSAA